MTQVSETRDEVSCRVMSGEKTIVWVVRRDQCVYCMRGLYCGETRCYTLPVINVRINFRHL